MNVPGQGLNARTRRSSASVRAARRQSSAPESQSRARTAATSARDDVNATTGVGTSRNRPLVRAPVRRGKSVGGDAQPALRTAQPGVADRFLADLNAAVVELARSALPEGVLFEALCETRVCLPDAIQLLTPCTTGNGRIKVVHVGRFALSLYDKQTGQGQRVFLDVGKMEAWPEIRSWFLKLKPKAEQDSVRLLQEIKAAGSSVLGTEPVAVSETFLRKQKLGSVQLCPQCGEAFPTAAGELCGGCRGELPYSRTLA